MNRKKKLNQIFNKRLKKAKAKLSASKGKAPYVTKADRVENQDLTPAVAPKT